MTDTELAEPDSGPHPYFLAIEDVFLELRGSPLQLSPKDWHIARAWHDAGVPLELVERVVREVFERRRSSEKQGKVWSLRHCKRAVESAWKRQQELTSPGSAEATEELDLAGRLDRLATVLPEHLSDQERVAANIRGLTGDAESIEARLTEIDAEVLVAVEAGLSAEDRQDVENELSEARRALAARLASDELERAAERLREEILRRLLNLPVLSLFAPEALVPEG